MIMVLCVMVVVVSLSLALLFSSSVMIQNAVRSNPKEQCRITAVSVSEVLRNEIERYEYEGFPVSDALEGEKGLKGRLQSVWADDWDFCVYDLEECGLPGDTMLEVYWADEEEADGEKDDLDIPDEMEELFASRVLYVKITSTVGNEKSTIVSRYRAEVELEEEVDSELEEELEPDLNEELDGEQSAEITEIIWRWNYEGREQGGRDL